MSNFSFFPQCFQKARFPGASKGVIVWEWVKKKMIVWYRNKVKTAKNPRSPLPNDKV